MKWRLKVVILRGVLAKMKGTIEDERSRLVSRNVTVNGRRTSLRLEPEIWEGLAEIAQREHTTINEVVARVDRQRGEAGLTSNVRIFVFSYFRNAATERGHANAGHGVLFQAGGGQRGRGGSDRPRMSGA